MNSSTPTHQFAAELAARCNGLCELCAVPTQLVVYEIPPVGVPSLESCVMLCQKCCAQIRGEVELDQVHWRCLQESAWSQLRSVQVLAWRILNRMNTESWAQDLMDQIYLDDETIEWAKSDLNDEEDEPTLDCNGIRLSEGDSVSIIRDLDVKGCGFVAKRGTIVKNIRLTPNSEQVEGRVNKTTIVLKTCYLKKAN